MDLSKAALVVCLTLFIVIGINAAIYVSLARRKHNSVGQIELLRRAASRARDPWEQENTDLRELSRRVTELKEKGSRDRPDHGK